jgi:toxin-antitoxin system PIN domain toxin
VIVVDTNLLVFAYRATAEEHEAARSWLNTQFETAQSLALPWDVLNAFVRLVSNPRIYAAPVTVSEAWGQVEEWLHWPSVWVPVPTPQHAAILAELHRAARFAANDVPDLHLAALAISHGLKLATHDRGFSRFEGLRWFDPLE